MDDAQEVAAQRTLMTRAVHAVLDRHGVAERQRLSTLMAVTQMSYQQVRRRMAGQTPWNVDEIKQLSHHFSEPLFRLLGSLVDDAGHEATLALGGLNVPCCVWVGPPSRSAGLIGPLVAIHNVDDDQWTVVPITEVGNRKGHEVQRLLFEAETPRRVAVAGVDKEAATLLVRFLRGKGLDAIAFASDGEFRAALAKSHFDGYVVEWKHGSSVQALLEGVRATDASGPLVVLAGASTTDDAEEEALAAALVAFRAQLYEKPARPLSVFNALQLGFAARRPAG